MVFIGRNIKIWILITLLSLLFWIIYWIPSSIERFFGFHGVSWIEFLQNGGGEMFMIMEISGAVGMIIRFAGVLIVIGIVLFLIWKGNKSPLEIKTWITSALILESIYYVLLLPSGLLMLGLGSGFDPRISNILLGIDFLLIVFLTAPFLLILAIKIYRTKFGENNFNGWIWISLTFVGYIASLWINSIMKWFDMLIVEGFSFFFIGPRALGMVNAFALMSLALIFAFVGAFSMIKQDFSSANKWVGLTLAIVGLHYLFFLLYSYFVNILSFVMLAEIWAIPLLGLGLTMLRKKE
jgi:hypothetical protein